MFVCTNSLSHTHTHTHTHSNSHAYTHTHTHTHTHTQTHLHTHTHTHTCTHTHTQSSLHNSCQTGLTNLSNLLDHYSTLDEVPIPTRIHEQAATLNEEFQILAGKAAERTNEIADILASWVKFRSGLQQLSPWLRSSLSELNSLKAVQVFLLEFASLEGRLKVRPTLCTLSHAKHYIDQPRSPTPLSSFLAFIHSAINSWGVESGNEAIILHRV